MAEPDGLAKVADSLDNASMEFHQARQGFSYYLELSLDARTLQLVAHVVVKRLAGHEPLDSFRSPFHVEQ